jgi:peptidoglycan/LPS O-acetylase OafA/YrhL
VRLAESIPEESVAARSDRRVPELDGLRGIAVALILLFHFSPYTGPLAWLRPVSDLGWIGLDLFFVLSGFLITAILLRTAGQPGYYPQFVIRRALRIFPLYFAFLTVFVALLYFRPDRSAWHAFLEWGSPLWFYTYLGNIRSVALNQFPPVDALVPLWSLHIEEQFYLVFPVLVALCRPVVLQRLLYGAVAVALICRCAFTVFAPDWILGTWWLTVSRMDGLALGGLLALSARHGVRPGAAARFRRLAASGAAACACMFVIRSTVEMEDNIVRSLGFTLVSLAFVGLLGAVMNAAGTSATGLLRWRPLTHIGRISYGLYLMHLPASLAMQWCAQPFATIEPHTSLNLPLSIAASYIWALVSWRYLESPILRFRDRITSLKPNAVLAPSEPSQLTSALTLAGIRR